MAVGKKFCGLGLFVWLVVLTVGNVGAQSLRREVDWPAGVAARLKEREYHFSPIAGEVWSAPNRAQGLRSRVDRGGLEVFPRATDASGVGAEWRLCLRTASFGRVGHTAPLSCRGLAAHANRIELDHARLVEWIVNDQRGVEQGWTLPSRPAGPDEDLLWIGLEFRGDLVPRAAKDGRSAVLVDHRGNVRLHYRDLAAWDAAGRDLSARLAPGPTGLGIRVDDAGAVYPITVDPTLVLGWTAEGDQAGASFGWSVATAGDVNGDGYSDLLVGAPHFDQGEPDEGGAFLFEGSPAGLSPNSVWSAEGDQANARFGISVSTAGDVNRDGFSDIVVGASLFEVDLQDQGRAYVFLGSSTGLSTSPAWTVESDREAARLGSSVSTAGDVNGDGYSDLIVGVPRYDAGKGCVLLFLGSETGLATESAWSVHGDQTFSYFGSSVSCAGDVNGDGYADVIVGHLFESPTGAAYVYLGSPAGLSSTAAWMVSAGQNTARFGRSVSTAGDVNGDGYSDVIVGAEFDQSGEEDEGRAYLYLGSATGLSTSPAWTGESDQRSAYFGYSVSTAGDVNGDGYSDVLVGSYAFDGGEQDEGRVFLYLGSEAGLSATAHWTGEANQASAAFGISVACAGDVNGDGFADIAAGAYAFENGEPGEGRVFVYHGSGTFYGLEPVASRVVLGDQVDAYLGYSVSAAGDVNGDGFSDCVVGAPHYDAGQENEGCAFVYLGSAAGLSTLPVWRMESDQAYAYFGWSVAIAGDVDGDGYAEVLVGSLGFDTEHTNEGRVFAYRGSISGPSTSAAWTSDGTQAGALMGSSVSGAGDVNGDGHADVLVGAVGFDHDHADEGRVALHLGGASGLSPVASWVAYGGQATARFGDSLAGAGDVDGDGYSDVIVGAPLMDVDEPDEGRAFVYLGSAFGLFHQAAWTATGGQARAAFGSRVAAAGDVNGDGYSDLLVGAELYDTEAPDAGRVFLYQGARSGLPATPSWTSEGTQELSFFGAAVASAGDVNGDGFSDVVVSAYGHDAGDADEGVVFLYEGSVVGLVTNATWTAEGDQLDARFGFDITSGDVNGDGYSDVLVGAIGHDARGSAFVFLGNEGRQPRIRALRQLQPDGSAPIALLGRSSALRSFSIRAEVPAGTLGSTAFLEWEIEPLGVAFDGLGLERSPVGQLVTLPALPLSFEEQLVTGSWSDLPVRWRARVVFVGQAGGRTPWFSLPGNAPTEAKLRLREPEGRIRRFSGSVIDGRRR